MNNRNIASSLLVAAFLTGCGGGSSEATKSSEVTVEPNTAPVATNDVGLSQNNNSISIDVLANDTDAEQDSLMVSAITVAPMNGIAEISGSEIIYTPNANYAGTDSLTYEISDGEKIASAEVQLDVLQSLSISGVVIDSPIANAVVTVDISGQVYTTTADVEGSYTLDVVIDNNTANLILSANGSKALGQENVEFKLVLGEASALLTQMNAEREFVSAKNATNITHVTTATYLLAKDLNEEESFSTYQEYLTHAANISAAELMETAAFIKLLVDDENYIIPSSLTVMTLLDGDAIEPKLTHDALNNYLVANTLVDAEGVKTEAYADALVTAIHATVNDPLLTLPFNEGMLLGESLVELPETKETWLALNADVTKFNSPSLATNYDVEYQKLPLKKTLNWSVENGKLLYNFDQLAYSNFYRGGWPNTLSSYGFEQNVIDAFIEAYENNTFSLMDEYQIKHGFIRKKISILSRQDNNFHVHIEGQYGYELVMPNGVTWQGENPIVVEDKNSNETYIIPNVSVLQESELADLTGDWILALDYTIERAAGAIEPFDIIGNDFVTINETTAVARLAKAQFSVDLQEGTIVLNQGDLTYRITPFKQQGKLYLAYTEKLVNNVIEQAYVLQMAKFDNSYTELTNNLVTELPEFKVANISSSLKEHWQGNKLLLDWVYGYQFQADGTLIRGIHGKSGDPDFGIDVDHFDMGVDTWTWDVVDNIVNLRYSLPTRDQHRIWEVIAVDDNGRTLIFEHSTIGYDDNNDQSFSEDEYFPLVFPRINIITKGDLRGWPEAWENTQELGLVN